MGIGFAPRACVCVRPGAGVTHTHTRARGASGVPLCDAKALCRKAGLSLCLREGKAGKVCPELHLAALCRKGAAISPVQSLQRKGASGGAAQTWGFVAQGHGACMSFGTNRDGFLRAV